MFLFYLFYSSLYSKVLTTTIYFKKTSHLLVIHKVEEGRCTR
ncbi:hypothetical protein HMPREF0083_01726, partial [Aneurinibacillus aneurinilyticus ATCC 12856]